ncbi:MAG: hypothetical protein HQL72_12935 [Magnetococcales bacterium]|nr:hypothetical protein [Magnetococcales bacterium]
MGVSDYSRILGLTLDAARPNNRVLGIIKSESSKVTQMFDQKAAKGSAVASNYTKTFASKAYTIELTAAQVRKGPVYAKPQ